MKANLGLLDRVIRVIIAVIFAILFFGGYVTGVFGAILLAIGIVFLMTSLVSFCPIYALFRLKTKQVKGEAG